MRDFKTRLGNNGRIVIPVYCRNQLNLHPGDELTVRVEDHTLRLLSPKQVLKDAQALVRQHAKNHSLVEQLKTLREEDT